MPVSFTTLRSWYSVAAYLVNLIIISSIPQMLGKQTGAKIAKYAHNLSMSQGRIVAVWGGPKYRCIFQMGI